MIFRDCLTQIKLPEPTKKATQTNFQKENFLVYLGKN